MNISVVIPLFNEAESLPELCAWIDKVMQANNYTYEVLLIDDGSKDNSWEVVEKISSENGKSGHVLDENLTIGCSSDSIKILELQRQGKNKQTTKEFLLGKKISKGSILNQCKDIK